MKDKTTYDIGHEHECEVDSEGAGQTTWVQNHRHKVEGGKVLPTSDGHTHLIRGSKK